MAALPPNVSKGATLGFALLIGVFGVVFLKVGTDEVTNEYETLHAARQANLFERGWLPDVLPSSAQKIVTRNNLDLNTSSGSFYFNPEHWKEFNKKLTRDESKPNLWHFKLNDSVWAFDCDSKIGHCSYVLSSNRHV